ncbi:MAG: 3-ketoacyl-CoA thiolase [Elusimicrobia bacterium]|nr:3-ketoacyl-CoA thiolase [Elusimicrobiota bacterium]
MKKLRKRIFMAAGYNTIALGSGRKEFNPKKPRPGLEEYIKEAGQGTLKQVGGAANIDEGVIGNFMASKFNNQGNLAGLIPFIDEGLRWKPSCRVEGACCSGGLALVTAIKSVLAETADAVLAMGVEVQNTVKAVYGADILAGAGWSKERKAGHAYFFPGKFSDRAGEYFKQCGLERSRKAMARWYRNAVENARLVPTAQEHHNKQEDLEAAALCKPNPKSFVDNLTVYDCSKVSDGAASIAVLSEEGLKKAGIDKKDAIEVVGFGQVEADLTKPPADLTRLDTTEEAVKQALASAGITAADLGTVECHDCFTITGILSVEAIGLAKHCEGADFVSAGHTARGGRIPFNTTGGLVGWGHPTGASGVRQAVTIWEQLTGKAGKWQIELPKDRPYALSISMGGNDRTVVAIVYRRAA